MARGTTEQRPARGARHGFPAQAMVEFALIGTTFLMILLGTIDFGRVIFMYSDMTNGVREGARYARIHPTDTSGTQNKVISMTSGLGLTSSGITVSCSGDCTTGQKVTVTATLSFRAITQQFLGLPAITLKATATDAVD